MKKLHFTRKHLGWFIVLTFFGVLFGGVVMERGFVFTLSIGGAMLAFAGMMSLFFVGLNLIFSKDKTND
jgi:hypothetical protein